MALTFEQQRLIAQYRLRIGDVVAYTSGEDAFKIGVIVDVDEDDDGDDGTRTILTLRNWDGSSGFVRWTVNAEVVQKVRLKKLV